METDPQAVESASTFFAQENRVLSHMAGRSGFSFEQGKQWAIEPEIGRATYDAKFFQDQGYTEEQALFASMHEINCHLVEVAELMDTTEGGREYSRFKQRSKTRKRLHVWENSRTDVKGNQGIIELAPALSDARYSLYKDKLFPETDFTTAPKHIQFSYAVIRRAMVPDEEVVVDPSVEAAIEKLRHVEGKNGKVHDMIALATNPHVDALTALQISARYIEPVINELFEEDVKDKQNSQDSGKSKGKGGQGNSEDQFESDYDDYEKRHPEPFNEGDLDKKIKEAKDAQSTSARQEAGYEEENGVSRRDTADYYSEYQQVERYIEPLRDIFRRITQQRRVPIRRLAALKEEGVMIDPGLITQTYMDAKSGIPNPKTMKDFEGRFVDENIPGEANFYFLYDQSGSMAGEKAVLQRRGAIVAAEALQEGDAMLSEEQIADPLALNINTAFMGFGSPSGTSTYKELSKGLTEQQRIAIFKGLLEFGSIGTNDIDGLTLIEKDLKLKMAQDSSFAEGVISGKRRVCVVVTTDGGSNYRGITPEQARSQTKKKAEDIRTLGVKVKAIAMAPNDEDKRYIKEVYGDDHTDICESEAAYPKSMETILSEVLESLEIS